MFIPAERKVVALVLAYVMVVMTTPVFAADFPKTKVAMGSVSAVGSIELRGVALLREGTIFSGDRLRSGEKAYGKVSLAGGQKLEIGERTDLTFIRDANRVRVVLTSGTMGFSNPSKEPLTVIANPFVIAAAHAAIGHVALLSDGSIGVRATDGTVTVTNTKTGASSQIGRGQERLIQTGSAPTASITELASNVPAPVPLPKLDPPGSQAPGTGGSPAPAAGSNPCRLCMDKGAWAALIAATGVTATAVVALVVAEHNKTNISNNNGTIAALAAKQSAQGNLQALESSSQQANSSGTQVASTANAVNAAIAAAQNVPAATRQSLTAQASALQSQAQASVQQIVMLQNQLQNLQSQLTGTTDVNVVASISGQIATIDANLSADITALNALIGQLNSLITAAQNAGVPNVPILTVQPIPLPVIASASSPA